MHPSIKPKSAFLADFDLVFDLIYTIFYQCFIKIRYDNLLNISNVF